MPGDRKEDDAGYFLVAAAGWQRYVGRQVGVYVLSFTEAWHTDQDYRYRFRIVRDSLGGTA